MISDRLTVLDLFSGAGGMALGFEASGARTVGAVEIDPVAAETFRRMFDREDPLILGGERGDMTRIVIPRLLDSLPDTPEVIVGGPPCQGFSRIGRAKQRSLVEEQDRVRFGGVRDPRRNELYRYFLEVVREARPLAFVMENVPGMREFLGVDIAGRIVREAAHLGYNVRYFLLNAAWYGVPQQRWRIFFVGIRTDLGRDTTPRPPARTHEFGPDIPEGVMLPEDRRMIWGEAIPRVENPLPVIACREALGDLPRLTGHLEGRRPDDVALAYRRSPGAWAETMRKWPGREAPEQVTGNWYRFTRRDYPIFREMAHGDCYPEAVVIARRMFHQHLAAVRAAGDAPPPGSRQYERLKRRFIPPYRNDAFNEKWRKLIPGEPSWVLTAHLSRDSYSHIHYHSAQARTITVREAARLQSFPDGFEFQGNFGDQYRQIGNAVPPLLARALARELLAQLRELTEALAA